MRQSHRIGLELCDNMNSRLLKLSENIYTIQMPAQLVVCQLLQFVLESCVDVMGSGSPPQYYMHVHLPQIICSLNPIRSTIKQVDQRTVGHVESCCSTSARLATKERMSRDMVLSHSTIYSDNAASTDVTCQLAKNSTRLNYSEITGAVIAQRKSDTSTCELK